jgi:hypothetical protein
MSLADNIALPRWCLNAYGHALIEQIIAERPEPSIGDAMGFKVASYRATSSASPVAKLRTLYRNWLDAELRALDANFHATGVWDQDASRAIYDVEDNDALIARALAETRGVVPFVKMRQRELPDGRHEVAA